MAVQETWFSRDLPLLQAIVQEADRTGKPVDVRKLDIEGLDRADLKVAIRALAHEDPPFFTKIEGSMADRYESVISVTGYARRAAGTWPSVEVVAERLVEQLASAADDLEDEETRSRLKKTVKWLGSTGRGVLIAAVGQALGGLAAGRM